MLRIKSLIESGKVLSAATFVNLLAKPSGSRIVPVDSTWYLPNAGRNGRDEYNQERIPGAVFLDIDAVKDESSPYPHMMPDKSTFNRHMGLLGLSRDDVLVVYDKQGNFSAPRAYWMLRAFNHSNSLLLNSFPLYKQLSGQLETGAPSEPVPTTYESPGLNAEAVLSYEQLKDIVENPAELQKYHILDARPAGRFSGADPEPRPGISSGHAPGAVSVPFNALVKDGQFAADADIGSVLKSRGVDNDKPIIVMCGTGVTACVVETALRQTGFTQPIQVYDGSWTEWAIRAPESLIVKD